MGGADALGQSELWLFGADGSGPEPLVNGAHEESLCQGADRTRFVFLSRERGAGSEWLMLGSGPERVEAISPLPAGFTLVCPFPAEAVGVLHGAQAGRVLARFDLVTREQKAIVEDVFPGARATPSADGRLLAIARTGGHELAVMDLVDGHGPALASFATTPAFYRSVSWSPDDRQLAWVQGPWDALDPLKAGTFDVYVGDSSPATGEATLRRFLTVDGRLPTITWSPEGRSLAVLERSYADEDCICNARGDLSVIDVASGSVREVASQVKFAGWSPVDAKTFAYATDSTLYVATDGQAMRTIAGPTDKLCVDCAERTSPHWPMFVSWSPDGRYILMGLDGVETVDLTTGQFRIILPEEGGVLDAKWWH
jgi:hypothetical protein